MTDTAALNIKKGLCPKCGEWVELTKAGRLRAHRKPDTMRCNGVKPKAKMSAYVSSIRFSVTSGTRG